MPGSERSVGDIVQKLFVAESTVHSHVKSIYAKLGVHNRLQAVTRGMVMVEHR